MNYMKQIAEMLGVELGEIFHIKDKRLDAVCISHPENTPSEYYIDNDGLHCDDCEDTFELTLQYLLAGVCEIVKLPWKPKKDEVFYYVTVDGAAICSTINDESASDIALIAFGNCFRTESDAAAHQDEISAKMKEVLGE